MRTMNSTRSSPRFPIKAPVECTFEGDTEEMQAANISRSGLLLVGQRVPAVGSIVDVHILLSHELKLKCKVCHQVHGCGVNVVAMNEEDQAKWNAYFDKISAVVENA